MPASENLHIRRHRRTISATFRSTAEITGKQNTNLPHFDMWCVRGLLQDPGHPVETPTEVRTCEVTKNVRVVVDVPVARGRVDRRRGNDRSVAMTSHAVVIAGGGPTGLMLAGELALAGVDVAIVERRASQDLAGSRAGGLHSRTIESSRSARNRRSVPVAGTGGSGRKVRRDSVGHQRLSHSAPLRAWAVAEPHRAHTGWLGRRSWR